jgi:16S rRNA processing protein RimM
MFREKCQEFGIVLKPHGVKGELLVKTNFQLPEQFEIAESIFLEIEGLLVPFFIEEYTVSSSESLILKLADINDKNKTLRFIDCKVFIECKGKYKTKNFSNTDEIIGYTLENQDGKNYGVITGIVDIPGNMLLTVTFNKKEILIPFHEQLFIKIDKRKKVISMLINPGLIDLN